MAEVDRPERAETLALSITNPGLQAQALLALARVIASAGYLFRAGTLAARANALIRPDTDRSAHRSTFQTWEHEASFPPDWVPAEVRYQRITDQYRQEWTLAAVAQAVSGSGNPERAETLACSITDPAQREWALSAVARAGSSSDHPEEVEELANKIVDPAQQNDALDALVGVVTTSDHPDQAEELANKIVDPAQQDWALDALARMVAASGHPDQAEALITRSMKAPGRRAQALNATAEIMARAGYTNWVEGRANSISDPILRASAPIALASTLNDAGNPERAQEIADMTEEQIRSIPPGDTFHSREFSLRGLAKMMAASDPDRAEALVRSIVDPASQEWELALIVKVIVNSGNYDRAVTLAQSIIDPSPRDHALATIASVIAVAGQLDQAEALARSIADPDRQAQALADIAKESNGIRARQLVALALRQGAWTMPLDALARVEPNAVLTIADLLARTPM